MVFWYWWMSKVLEKNGFGEYENVGVKKYESIEVYLLNYEQSVFRWNERMKRDNLINNYFCVLIFKIDFSKMFHEH